MSNSSFSQKPANWTNIIFAQSQICCPHHNGELPFDASSPNVNALDECSSFTMLTPQFTGIQVPVDYLFPTNGLVQLIEKAAPFQPVFFPVGKVCALHHQGKCSFGNRCKRVHLCRKFLVNQGGQAKFIEPTVHLNDDRRSSSSASNSSSEISRNGSQDLIEHDDIEIINETKPIEEFTEKNVHVMTPLSRLNARLKLVLGEQPLPSTPVMYFSNLMVQQGPSALSYSLRV